MVMVEGLRDSDVAQMIYTRVNRLYDINQDFCSGNEVLLLRLFTILEYGINTAAKGMKV